MASAYAVTGPRLVALRKESVDRNERNAAECARLGIVALRKESVDRNMVGPPRYQLSACRSPQGERG